MTSDRKHFAIGDIQCIAISDGSFAYPPDWLFSNVPKEQLEITLRDHRLPADQVATPYTCLILKIGKKCVLIDTGADGLAPTTGNLFKQLEAESISRDQINTVVLTHAHPDHIGGMLDQSGKPAFPNAEYVMSRTEWDFWTSRPSLSESSLNSHMKEMLIGSAEKNLLPLKDRMRWLDGEKEITPGVHAFPAPGHTPGHIGLVISSSKTQFLHIADAVLHPMHLKYPAWRSMFDLDLDGAARTRQRLLDRAAADQVQLLAYHFPFPSLGRVAARGPAWQWEPAAD